MGVIQNTSPLGADGIAEELEDMRRVLEKLRVLCGEEEGRLQGLLRSRGACEKQRRQLETELGEFRKDLQRLAEEGLEPPTKAGTEDDLVARWRRYSVSRIWRRYGPSGGCGCLGASPRGLTMWSSLA